MRTLVNLLRRVRTLLWTALSIVIILCAVLVGLGKLLMPYSANYQLRLEAWLSEEFGRPVEIESFTGEWKAFGPQLSLQGLRLPAIDGGDETAVIEKAVIEIKPFNVLLPSRALYNFRVVGADFQLVHRLDGSFEFFGLGVSPGKGQSDSALKQLASISEVLLEDSSLQYDDEVHNVHLNFRAIGGRLLVRGDDIMAEIGFRIAHGAAGRVSGEFEATAHLTMGPDKHPLSARWQLSGQELMLDLLRDRLPSSAYFPQQGRLNTEIWGEWDREMQHYVRGVVDLRQARLATAEFDRSVERINTRFKWHFTDLDEWRLDLSDFTFNDGLSSFTVNSLGLGRSLPRGIGLWLSADALPIETPVAIAGDVVRAVGKAWPRYLPGHGVGVVQDFELILNRNMKLGTAFGTFKGGSVSNWDVWPDISNVDGRLEFGPGNGRLILNGKDVVVEWPRMFASPVQLDMPSCVVAFNWGPEKGKYQVMLPECSVENEFVSARSEMSFRSNTGKPAVDVMVHADRLDVSAVGDYWPRDLLNERVIAWLESGLLEGQLESGQLQIYGDIDDWPFDHGEGRFEAIARVRNAEIAYFEGWPNARGVDGTAHFVNAGMDILGVADDIGGVPLQEVRARIQDFRNAELLVDYRAEAELAGLIDFMRQSPINGRIGADLSRFDFEGDATTNGSLLVPFGQGGDGVQLAGSLQLPGNSFSAPELDITLDGIAGSVDYNQSGFEGRDLAAAYLGVPADLAIRAGNQAAEPGAGPGSQFEARLTGNFEVMNLLPGRLLDSWSPLTRIEGSSRWEATIRAGGGKADFRLASGLEGVAIRLPAPLDKAATARWPFEINYPLGGDSRELRIDLANRLSARVAVVDDLSRANSAAIRIGPGQAELPADGLLEIGGTSDIVDLDGWIGLVIEQARQGKGLGGLKLQSGTLTAGQIRLLDRRFDEVKMAFTVDEGMLNADFDGESINGKVTFVGVRGGSQSLSAEFERMVLGEPLTSGMKMDVDPASLPALHLYAKSFRYGDVELGETRIEAYPKAEGFHFEYVEAESPNMSVRASGDWSLHEGDHRSTFDINMASESLGNFLRQLGIASPMEGGQTLVHFGVWWDGSPGQFRLARLNGDVNFSVNSGVINNASPGSGRLLGLLSVQALPRRLALDFRDVFDSGFAFEEANGSFTMLNGFARTDDVTLKSSAANISFSGTTDLVGREFDQLITVRPGLGNTLPVIGAIAGGPGGAAAGLALQGLLHEGLGEASQVQYTLTGAWDEPQIEPVIKSRTDG